jgi:iron complex outermembrane recepter protein
MKRIIMLAIAGFMLIAHTYAQASYSIRGVVRDSATGEAIYGASIYISELNTGAVTDTAGFFHIRNLPNGKFLTEIRMIGYASRAIELWSHPNTEGQPYQQMIRLVRTPSEYHPVIITGTSGATERIRNPVPNALQTRDHMLQHGNTNAITGLTELPGVSSVNTGNAISKPVIRGLGYNRVVVLRNGIRQEGQQWGDEHGIEIDEFEIDRVEIVKGPGSIMYGSDAMAGVINFMTPRPVHAGYIGGEILTGFQSNGNVIGNSIMQEGNVNGCSWQFRMSQKLGGNYSTPADGYVANTGFKEFNFSGFVGLNRTYGVSQISFSSFNQTVALPEGERDSLGRFFVPVIMGDSIALEPRSSDELRGYNHHLDMPQQRIQHHRVVLSNNIVFERSRLQLDLAFQQNYRREFADMLNPDEPEIGMRLNTYNLNATYIRPGRNESQFSVGLSGQQQNNVNSGEEYIIPDYAATDAGLFFYYKKIAGPWFFGAGARGDVRFLQTEALFLDTNEVPSDSGAFTETKFSRTTKSFAAFSGVAGVSYQVTKDFCARVNIARGFRVPNLAELASNGRHEGTFRYEVGSASLKPEYSFQGDAGITYASDHFNLEVSVFYNDIQNFIYLTKVNAVGGGDSIRDPDDPAPVFTFTQGHATLFGGEIYTDLHPHPLDWLHFENSLSFVQGALLNQPDSMTNLPFMPPIKYQSELNAHGEKKRGIFQHYYAGVSFVHYFQQDRIYSAYGTETKTPAYFLLDVNAGTEIVNKHEKVVLRIFLSANNVLNTTYQSHLSRLKYAPVNPVTGNQGIYGMGRNFSVRLLIPLTFQQH